MRISDWSSDVCSSDLDAIGAPLIEWHVKSTTKAHQGLYEHDAVARLRDGQLGDERVHDIANYITRGKLWDAFTSPRARKSVVYGKGVSVCVDLGGRRALKQKNKTIIL